MTREEEKFLKENFPAGEYCTLTMLVRNEDLNSVIELLKNSNKKMVLMPQVKAASEFLSDDTDKKEN